MLHPELADRREEGRAAAVLDPVVQFDMDRPDRRKPGFGRGEDLLLAALDVHLEQVDPVQPVLPHDLIHGDRPDAVRGGGPPRHVRRGDP
jgi:hypothetical protein